MVPNLNLYEFLKRVPGTSIEVYLYRRYSKRDDQPDLWGCDLIAIVADNEIGRKIQGDWALKPFDVDKWAQKKLSERTLSVKKQINYLEAEKEKLFRLLQQLESA
jgi:hypothetical protein